jgi:serine/threonine protein kinase
MLQILNRGHDWGADHWSLGVLTFEMIFGQQPFYTEGMDQVGLFRAIVNGEYSFPGSGISTEAANMIRGFLTRTPSQRLGSLAGGEDDILSHRWFTDIDFDKLRKQEMKAPFVPRIKNPLDASNFDDWSHLKDKTKTRYPKISKEQADVFSNF